MAQTGYTPILIYSSSTASSAPSAGNLTNSTLGSELAINITDGKLFYKDNANAVQVIGWKTVPTTAGGTGLTSYTAGDTVYYASGTTFTKLAIGASKTIMTSSGTAPQWSASLDTTQGGTGVTSYTAGDLTYYASGTALTKLGIGTAYYMLGVNAGATAPSWQPSSTSVLTTQGDLLYASAANTLARLAKNTTASRYLSNSGTSNNPAWAQVDLTNGVTGTLPIGNGGTGQTSFTAGYIHYGSFSTSSNLFWDATNNRLGIGTTTPSDIIGLGGNSDRAIMVERITTAGTSGSFLQLKAGGAYSGGTNLNGGDIYLYTGTSTGSGSANIRFYTATAGASGTTDRAPTEKVRFWGSGGVSINNTTDQGFGGLRIGDSSTGAQIYLASSSSGSYITGVSSASSSNGYQIGHLTNVNTFQVQVGGSGGVQVASGGTSWTAISDERLKDVIEPITSAINKVAQLRSVIGKYKTDPADKRRSFVIAQDVMKVLPEAVSETTLSKDDEQTYMAVAYTELIPLLVAAINEMSAEIKVLKGN